MGPSAGCALFQSYACKMCTLWVQSYACKVHAPLTTIISPFLHACAPARAGALTCNTGEA